jgi:hypothetical protein
VRLASHNPAEANRRRLEIDALSAQIDTLSARIEELIADLPDDAGGIDQLDRGDGPGADSGAGNAADRDASTGGATPIRVDLPSRPNAR